MPKKIDFKYFLDGKEIHKSEVNWDSNITVKIIEDRVYVATVSTGYLSTRHKHPPGGYNKED